MFAAVIDTHAVIWYLGRDTRLSQRAKDLIDASLTLGRKIGVCSITLVEMVYLVEKGRISADRLSQLMSTLAQPDAVLEEVPLDHSVIESVVRVSRNAVPDLPDRIIAATALRLSVPLISRDAKIRVSGIKTIW